MNDVTDADKEAAKKLVAQLISEHAHESIKQRFLERISSAFAEQRRASLQASAIDTGARPWERTRVCVAAEIASNKFQQWVPQRWLELFMDAYEAAEPPPAGE